MSDGFRTPFDKAIVNKASYNEKPTLNNATDKVQSEGLGSVTPKELPENNLKHGSDGKK